MEAVAGGDGAALRSERIDISSWLASGTDACRAYLSLNRAGESNAALRSTLSWSDHRLFVVRASGWAGNHPSWQFGALLRVDVAVHIVNALISDPMVTDEQLRRGIPNYEGSNRLGGPGSFRPDFELSGDNGSPCRLVSLQTRRWSRLDKTFRGRLGAFMRALSEVHRNDGVVLDLLCCSYIPGAYVPEPVLDDLVAIHHWQDVL